MHLMMILAALAIASGLRFLPIPTSGSWQTRWQRSLFLFLFPPLILITTVSAVLLMGAEGYMLGLKASQFAYGVAILFSVWLLFRLGALARQVFISQRQIQTYPLTKIQDQEVRLIPLDLPYIAQIGFWQPQLVISQNLVNILTEPQLDAVIEHEQAHYYYRDTFYFFWLGWLKNSTFWLNNTETLWQELLLLREIRADLKAARQVDPLTLAESLLRVVQTPLTASNCFTAGFSLPVAENGNRLVQRIEALISNKPLPTSPSFIYWSWLLLLLIPWATIPLHC